MNAIRSSYVYLKHFVRREIDYHRVKPALILLFLTYRCTSRCKACRLWQRKEHEPEMGLEDWKHFIDTMAGQGIENVEMFGGDALLRKDVLFPLCRYVRSKGIPNIDLVTNCNLMDEKTARDIVDSGVTKLYISVDGTGELHDYIRGVPGSFERIKKCIGYVRAARSGSTPKIIINCTVSALNLDGFEKVLPFAEEVGADNVAFEYVGEFPRDCLTRSQIDGIVPEPYYMAEGESILLTREQAIVLKQKLKTLKETARNMRVSLWCRNIDVLHIENLSGGVFPHKRCYICRQQMTMDPYGNIMPCPFFHRYTIGNVREQDTLAIWKNERHRNFLRHLDDQKVEMCKHCIVSVERNPTFLESIRNTYFTHAKKGYDE